MRCIESEENAPSTDLEAAVHQNHRGLTVVLLRRKGRGGFYTIQLEGKDGAPVGHREPPNDKPGDIAKVAWERMTVHAQQHGAGTYEAELRFAAGERGAPPKPVIVQMPVGVDMVDLGQGPDSAVLLDVAIRLADFSCRKLADFMHVLPLIAKGTTDNLQALQAIGEQMLTAQREAASASTQVELARIEARKSSDRTQLARDIAAPGIEVLKRALGLGPAPAQTMKAAAAVAATMKPTTAVATTTTPSDPPPAMSPETSALDKALTDVLEAGRKLGASIDDTQARRLGEILGMSFEARARGLRESSVAQDVIQLVVDIVDAGDKLAGEALEVLSNAQTELVLKVRGLCDDVVRLRAAAEGASS